MSDPISEAVDLLNDVLERDPEAIRLINMRVDCNESQTIMRQQRFKNSVKYIG